MKHLKSYKIFEGKDLEVGSKNFCDDFYKRLDDISVKAKLDKSKVVEEYTQTIGECMNDLTDDFECDSELCCDGTLMCWYEFRFRTIEFRGKWDNDKGCLLWESTLDKFEEDSESVLSKLEGLNIPYSVRVEYDGVVQKSDFKSIYINGLKHKLVQITFSIGD